MTTQSVTSPRLTEPGRVHSVTARLDRLTPAARTAVKVAALVGHRFDAGQLADVAETTTAHVEALVPEAVAAGLLVRDGDRLGFPDDMTRRAVSALIPPALRRPLLDRLNGRRCPATLGLTAAEATVVRLVAEGATNRQVAATLGLSPHTVNAHLRRAFPKLGVTSRVELVHIVAAAPGRFV